MTAHDEGMPAFTAPPFSCDAHFHVFGPADRYPCGTDLRYRPPCAPLDDYLALAAKLGMTRYVFVQPSAYGRDNTCMLDAMREVNARRGPVCRGIVDIGDDTTDDELARMHAIGVRGVRINFSPIKPREAGLAAALRPRVLRLGARLAEIGWQLDFLMPGWLTSDMMGTLRELPVDYTLAHMGMFLAKDGPEQPGFVQLLDLLRGGEGRCWVKFTGTYRMSTAPRFADAAPMARALIAAAPDRVIWGSDYPHLSFADNVGSVELYNLLAHWAPDAADRERILVTNPQRLYGF